MDFLDGASFKVTVDLIKIYLSLSNSILQGMDSLYVFTSIHMNNVIIIIIRILGLNLLNKGYQLHWIPNHGEGRQNLYSHLII